MRDANKNVALISGVFLVFVLVSHARPIQQEEKIVPLDLSRNVGDYDDKGADLFHLLDLAAKRLGIPLGIEVNGPFPSEVTSIHISNATAGDVFTVLVQRAPDYIWTVEDGVIDVLPRKNAGSLLDVKIAHFEIRDATWWEIGQAITSLPEVKAWLAHNNVVERSPIDLIMPVSTERKHNCRTVHTVTVLSSGEPRLSLDLSNTTLRAIMNRMVSKKNSGFRAWYFVRYKEDKEYLSIQII
jgi:hypothetical protein